MCPSTWDKSFKRGRLPDRNIPPKWWTSQCVVLNTAAHNTWYYHTLYNDWCVSGNSLFAFRHRRLLTILYYTKVGHARPSRILKHLSSFNPLILQNGWIKGCTGILWDILGDCRVFDMIDDSWVQDIWALRHKQTHIHTINSRPCNNLWDIERYSQLLLGKWYGMTDTSDTGDMVWHRVKHILIPVTQIMKIPMLNFMDWLSPYVYIYTYIAR